ncbi:hypothetical protein [Streptomyces filamentosus]|uniref:hypothetical protein n=1 Tax=Streptomyces filamentosus TaxID=67294 RepID=UPI0033FAA9DD
MAGVVFGGFGAEVFPAGWVPLAPTPLPFRFDVAAPLAVARPLVPFRSRFSSPARELFVSGPEVAWLSPREPALFRLLLRGFGPAVDRAPPSPRVLLREWLAEFIVPVRFEGDFVEPRPEGLRDSAPGLLEICAAPVARRERDGLVAPARLPAAVRPPPAPAADRLSVPPRAPLRPTPGPAPPAVRPRQVRLAALIRSLALMAAAVTAVAAAARIAKMTTGRPNWWISQHSEISPVIAPPGRRSPARLSSFCDAARRR